MDKKMNKKFLKDSFKETYYKELEKLKKSVKETELSKKSIKKMSGLKEKSLKELIEDAKI